MSEETTVEEIIAPEVAETLEVMEGIQAVEEKITWDDMGI